MTTLWTTLAPALFFVGSFACIGIAFKLGITRSSKQQNKTWALFQKREHEANFITKKDFPSSLLLTFETDNIPYIANLPSENLYDRLMSFSDKRMVDLTGYSNVELKETFGINHFTTLLQCEERFFVFCDTLYAYALQLEQANYRVEAKQLVTYVLENNWQHEKFTRLQVALNKPQSQMNDKEV